MTKHSIREFKLAVRGGDGLHPWLDEHGAFLGGGVALLTKNNFGDFAPLPRRDLETILSAGYGITVDLGSRMHGLAALAKALNQGDHALATIVLVQLQFPALPDGGAGARMRKAAAMLEHGASAAEVLRHFLANGELAKFNPYHLGPGPGGGPFTTAEMDGTSSGDAKGAKDIHSVNISATTNGHTHGDHVFGDAVDVNIINGVHVDSSDMGLAYAYELESAAMNDPNVRYVEAPFGNFVRTDADSDFSRSERRTGDQRHVHISVFPER